MAFGEQLKLVKELCPNNKNGTQILLGDILSVESPLKKYTKMHGLYGFWLKKEDVPDFNTLNFKLEVKSKVNEDSHKVSWNWNHEEKYIPLYIGKSTVIGERIRQHLGAISEKSWIPKGLEGNFVYKRNSTTCQFRAGLEQLLRNTSGLVKPGNQNALDYFKDTVIIKILEEPGVENRFYLEDYSIGYYRPWFNIDAER
ncbi:MAG: hypothetical protein IPN99_16310 [Bacteroidetes bacterium]|nr:hypothetical protein [Bacteroidota bacterium]